MLQILELRPMIALRFTWDSSNFLFEFVVNFKYASVTVQIKCIKYKSPLNLEQSQTIKHPAYNNPRLLHPLSSPLFDYTSLNLSITAALGHWVMETSGLVIGSLGKV
nr:hypothetical protein CFP56_10660 [Quercus suber]